MYWILILFFLFSCVPKHDLAKLDNDLNVETALKDAVKSGEFATGEWPEVQWWKSFQDPALNWLMEASLKHSPSLLIAEERLKASMQVALQTRARIYPDLGFTVDNNWMHLAKQGFFRSFAPTVPAVVNDVTLGFNFYWEFDFWGKNHKLFNAALGRAQALAAERMQAELILTTSVAYTYAQLQLLLRQKQILLQKQANTCAIGEIRKGRENHALDNAFEPLNSQSEVYDIQADIHALDQEIQIALHKLKAISGLGQDAELNLEFFPIKTITVALPEKLGLDLIGRRPDLVAQKALVEAASLDIGAAKTDFYPNIDLVGLIGFESVHWSTILQARNYSATINPALHLPIFTAGRLKAHLWEKVAQFNEASYSYNQLILQAAQEVSDRLSDMMLLQKQIEDKTASLKITEKELSLTKNRYQHAIDDLIAVYRAENRVLDTQLMVAELEYGKQLAAILLIRALGGGTYE